MKNLKNIVIYIEDKNELSEFKLWAESYDFIVNIFEEKSYYMIYNKSINICEKQDNYYTWYDFKEIFIFERTTERSKKNNKVVKKLYNDENILYLLFDNNKPSELELIGVCSDINNCVDICKSLYKENYGFIDKPIIEEILVSDEDSKGSLRLVLGVRQLPNEPIRWKQFAILKRNLNSEIEGNKYFRYIDNGLKKYE